MLIVTRMLSLISLFLLTSTIVVEAAAASPLFGSSSHGVGTKTWWGSERDYFYNRSNSVIIVERGENRS